MKWKLTYSRVARDRLARLLDGAEPAVILAVARLNAVLETCPRSIGESREAGRRVAFDGPIGVRYRLDEADRQVRVTDVRRAGRRDGGEPTEPEDESA